MSLWTLCSVWNTTNLLCARFQETETGQEEEEEEEEEEGRNIAEFSRGGIYKPSLKAEILQNSQEVEFINHQYGQKYFKILKRWNL